MRLTKAQRELLTAWHELDVEAGCRQWRKAAKASEKSCNIIANAGLLLVRYSATNSVWYMLTDEAVQLLERR